MMSEQKQTVLIITRKQFISDLCKNNERKVLQSADHLAKWILLDNSSISATCLKGQEGYEIPYNNLIELNLVQEWEKYAQNFIEIFSKQLAKLSIYETIETDDYSIKLFYYWGNEGVTYHWDKDGKSILPILPFANKKAFLIKALCEDFGIEPNNSNMLLVHDLEWYAHNEIDHKIESDIPNEIASYFGSIYSFQHKIGDDRYYSKMINFDFKGYESDIMKRHVDIREKVENGIYTIADAIEEIKNFNWL